MHFLEYFYLKNLKFDLYNKFNYGKTKYLPKIKKIILNFGWKTNDLKCLTSSLLALELITQQKGTSTTTKHSNILLKIKKGNPVGCKVTLRKKQMFLILEKISIVIFPKIKNFKGLFLNNKFKTNSFSFELLNILNFTELESHYNLFNSVTRLSITLVTNTKTNKELIFLLHSVQFPFKNS